MIKKSLVLTFFVGVFMSVNGQNVSKKKLKEFQKKPVWIQLKDNPQVNYHEAKLAFETYWKNRQSPESILEGEEEEGGEEKERSLLSRIFVSESTYQAEILQYTTEYKKMKFWLMDNAGFVKEDGTVMTEEEKLAMVQQELINRSQNPTK